MIRKKLRDISALDDGEKFLVLRRYKDNIPMSSVSEEFRVTEHSLKVFIDKEYKEFLVSKESHCLYDGKKMFNNLKVPADINTKFLERIEEGAALSYAYYYAMTNDNVTALRESDLLVGIIKQRNKNSRTTRAAEKLRGLYLRSIPEVAAEIKRVQEDRLLSSPINKTYVQSELVTQLEELKEIVPDMPQQRSNLLKTIDMLGRSIGAFSERIEVSDVTPDKSLDMLIEMSKKSVVTPVDASYQIEDNDE